MAIEKDTRRIILDDLILIGDVFGNSTASDFAERVYPPISSMKPLYDKRYSTAVQEIWQHMEMNDDWDLDYFFNTRLGLMDVPDDDFVYFLEQYVSPTISRRRRNEDEEWEIIPQEEIVETINKYLEHDGYQLVEIDRIAEKIRFKAESIRVGVKGSVKNIIFAAKYKPEIVFDDALNNDIRITQNEEHCLIYDRDVPRNGIHWEELVDWYAENNSIVDDKENTFCRRLVEAMDSEPEKIFLRAYYRFIHDKDINPAALIPQVYLYYDPLTLKQRGYKLFEHQKMDFLMIFSHRDRVVIEIDGKQHYADGDIAKPSLYADMVKAQREMTLYGYDVYRFGGAEFCGEQNNVITSLQPFFERLFSKYRAI